ncbi:MAG: T9SS type A sorting domain-containing protein [Ignavibacteria bacterium]|nr:T9SS type A sorting domain-containing protein [Ignavibacteria bacterium]
MKIKFFFVFTFLISLKLFSQPDEEWVRRYNGPGNTFDIVTKLILGNNNDLFVYGNSSGTGSLYDFVIINYDRKGNIKWTQTYNGPGNSTDQISSACIDGENNSYVTGFTTDSAFHNIFTTAKYDSSGNLIWMNEYRNTEASNSYGKDITMDNSGNVFACGAMRYTSTGKYTTIVLKYSPEGNLLNELIFDTAGSAESIPVKLQITTAGDIIVAGSIEISPNNKNMHIRYFKNFPNPSSWTKTISGSSGADDEITDMILDNENNIYFCGSIRNGSLPDYYFAKISPEGIVRWDGSYNGVSNNADIPYSIKADTSGNIILTGYSRNSNSSGSEDILTVKVSPAGYMIWNKIYNGPGNGTDQGISAATDEAGNIYVGGASDRGNVELIYVLLKYNSDGTLMWTKNYNGNSVTEDFIYDVKLDKEGNIYVTGISIGNGSGFDFATIKYSQTVGIDPNQEIIPDEFTLYQNYPNPFNPETVIRYSLIENGFVSLKVYDVLGNEVATLVNEKQNPGTYNYQFSTVNYQLSSGIYFYRLKADGMVLTKKMTLIK